MEFATKIKGLKSMKKMKARVGGLSELYFDICEEEFSKTIFLEDELIMDVAPYEIEDEYIKSGIKSVIFSAMCLEAAINDFGGWQLGDKFYKDHFDSLALLSKWVVIPSMVCGKSINKSGPAFSALNSLVSFRNRLVHNKSKKFSVDSNLELNGKLDMNKWKNEFHNSYRAIVLLSIELEYILGPEFHVLRPFRTLEKHSSYRSPANLKGVIDDCLRISSI